MASTLGISHLRGGGGEDGTCGGKDGTWGGGGGGGGGRMGRVGWRMGRVGESHLAMEERS